MAWHEKYLGIPFVNGGSDFAGCDCAGLVLLMLREERGFEARSLHDEAYGQRELHTRAGQARLARMVAASLADWRELAPGECPQALDMALYEFGGAQCHCAAVVDTRHVIHVEETRPSRLAHLKNPGPGYRLTGIYRHV